MRMAALEHSTLKRGPLVESRKGNLRLVAHMSSCHIYCPGQSLPIPCTTRRIVEVTHTLPHWVVQPTIGLVGTSFLSFHFGMNFLWTSAAIVTTTAPAWVEHLALFWVGSLNKNLIQMRLGLGYNFYVNYFTKEKIKRKLKIFMIFFEYSQSFDCFKES